jgi:hypothetical protein
MPTVHVHRVHIPPGSTIGYGYGTTDKGDEVSFAGDHRPMRDLGDALGRAHNPIPVDVEDWQMNMRHREPAQQAQAHADTRTTEQKLEAMAAPGSGASEGERENAKHLLFKRRQKRA